MSQSYMLRESYFSSSSNQKPLDMSNLTANMLREREAMNKTTNIRNISVIGHFKHGKSMLTDNIVARARIIMEKPDPGQFGQTHYTDTRTDEQELCISIKSTAMSMYFELEESDLTLITNPELFKENEKGFLINLIDTPGHVDFSSEVTAALRITDGALLVVDTVTGVCMQTEAVLRQAVAERVKPVLFLNKVDLAITDLQLDPEQLYQTFHRIVDNVNTIISTSDCDSSMGEVKVDPSNGSVGFGSALLGWDFTLRQIAEMYADTFDVDPEKLMDRLWGENFFNEDTKEWSTQKEESNTRAFCLYVLDPIYKMFDCIMNFNKGAIKQLLLKLGFSIDHDELINKERKDLLGIVLNEWLPAGTNLLQMIATHLPSPVVSQKYRMDILYNGPRNDDAAVAIQNCDPEAPLMMYVSKMVPTPSKGQFYAVGRIFSGKVQTGQNVIVKPGFNTSNKEVLLESSTQTQGCFVMMGRRVEAMENVPCGNICGILCEDQVLETGTITTFHDAHRITDPKHKMAPVACVAVEPIDPDDLPKLVEGLQLLEKSDNAVQCFKEESGTHVVAGVGELHLEICVKDLEENYACIPIKKSEPFVSYREGVACESKEMCMVISPNGRNNLTMKAQPMPDALVKDIEEGRVKPHDDLEARASYLHDNYKYDVNEARNIWSFGPDGDGPNILVDCSKGVQYLDDIKHSIMAAFQLETKEGVLASENMRGLRFDIYNASFNEDASLREPDEIIAMTRTCLRACALTALPQLIEPYYQCEIQCPEEIVGSIYGIMNRRRGYIFEETRIAETPLSLVKCYIPVVDSFGLADDVCRFTEGKAVSQCVFHEWKPLPGDALMEGGTINNIIKDIRKRKMLKEDMQLWNPIV